MADVNTLSANAQALWGRVQSTFSALGLSTTLTSAGRSPEYNSTIAGASSGSQHIGGNAFDFQVRDSKGNIIDPLKVQATLATQGLVYGQNIAEYGRGMNPRNHLSTIGYRKDGSLIGGENLVTRGGAYQPIKIDASNSIASGIADQARGWVRDIEHRFLTGLGFSTENADVLTNPNSGVVETAGAIANSSQWILRGAIGAVALLLLGAAIFSIAKGNNPATLIKGAIS